MKTRFKHLLLWAVLCLPVSTTMATSWAYTGYYPWIYSFQDGWFYHSPVQKVYQDGEWVLNPMGNPYDISPIFAAPLATFSGTNGDQFVFRLTISSEFPHLGLLAIGDLPSITDEPIVTEVDETARVALDPSILPDLPDPDNERRFDSYYLVRIHKTHDDVLAHAYVYFQAPKPFLTWADRGPIHGMIRFNFKSIEHGRFVVAGTLDNEVGLEAYRGNFKVVAHEPPPPPPLIDPTITPGE